MGISQQRKMPIFFLTEHQSNEQTHTLHLHYIINMLFCL